MLVLAMGTAAASASAQAAAPTKTECSQSHASSQELRLDGKLLEARKQLRTCSDPACPSALQTDCAGWLVDVEQAIPSVDFLFDTAAGKPQPTVLLDGRALAMGALLLFEEGHVERAFEWSRRAVDLYPEDLSALLNNACLNLRSGRHEEALDMIERVFGRGWGKRDWVENDPDYDAVREHPRFKAVFKNLK